MRPMRIMLTGSAGVGKSALATVLSRKIDPDGRDRVCVVAFADALKDQVREMLNMNQGRVGFPFGRKVPDHRGEGLSVEWRNLLRPIWQWYGTEWMRSQSPDYWVDLLEETCGMYIKAHWPVIVTDCRFPNELDWGKDNGFLIVRIVGPDRRLEMGGEPVPAHASELPILLSQADMILDNTGNGIGHLESLADDIIKRIESEEVA